MIRSSINHKHKILIVGQTPPPYGGQAIMVETLLNGRYHNIELFHVRMAFSNEMDEIGKFRIVKLFKLLAVILKIISKRFRHRINILYYPPAGPDKIPMYRDLVILLSTRWMFKYTVFHFHAAGISELINKLPPHVHLLFRKAYFGADLAIQTSDANPPDAKLLEARKAIIVPNGIEDHYPEYGAADKGGSPVPTLLFVSVLKESKGLLVFLDACRVIKETGLRFTVKIMGKFESEHFRDKVYEFIDSHNLRDSIEFLGVKSGNDKWKTFSEADIFCFPTFFESESFGLVVLEAMQFKLPVVATCWRGVPAVVEDGSSGFIIPIKDSQALADKIAVLLQNPKLREAMGMRGREIYLDQFTVERFWRNMEEAFLSVLPRQLNTSICHSGESRNPLKRLDAGSGPA